MFNVAGQSLWLPLSCVGLSKHLSDYVQSDCNDVKHFQYAMLLEQISLSYVAVVYLSLIEVLDEQSPSPACRLVSSGLNKHMQCGCSKEAFSAMLVAWHTNYAVCANVCSLRCKQAVHSRFHSDFRDDALQ